MHFCHFAYAFQGSCRQEQGQLIPASTDVSWALAKKPLSEYFKSLFKTSKCLLFFSHFRNQKAIYPSISQWLLCVTAPSGVPLLGSGSRLGSATDQVCDLDTLWALACSSIKWEEGWTPVLPASPGRWRWLTTWAWLHTDWFKSQLIHTLAVWPWESC